MDTVSNLIKRIFDSQDGEEQNGNSIMEIRMSILNPDEVKSESIDSFKNVEKIELYFEKDGSEEVTAVEDIENEPMNIPAIHECLNCETHFPSKHHCSSKNNESKSSQASYDLDHDKILLEYKCNECFKLFANLEQLVGHQERECLNFQCEFCFNNFSQNGLLIHKKKNCEKSTTTSKLPISTTNNKLSVPAIRPYVCHICGRTYKQLSHLKQHIRFHEGIKPFACSYEGCQARFTIKQDLRDHICKVHTRERPFECNVCNKRFLTGSVYYQHRMIHTNDRRYACDVCAKTFIRNNTLKNHYRIHTNEKPYQCSYNDCRKSFRQKNDRNLHMRTQHSNVQYEHN